MSVAVMMNIIADDAGSFPNFFIINGISEPNNPAMNKLNIIASPITTPNMIVWFSIADIIPTIIPTIIPFIIPAVISFSIIFLAFLELI